MVRQLRTHAVMVLSRTYPKVGEGARGGQRVLHLIAEFADAPRVDLLPKLRAASAWFAEQEAPEQPRRRSLLNWARDGRVNLVRLGSW